MLGFPSQLPELRLTPRAAKLGPAPLPPSLPPNSCIPRRAPSPFPTSSQPSSPPPGRELSLLIPAENNSLIFPPSGASQVPRVRRDGSQAGQDPGSRSCGKGPGKRSLVTPREAAKRRAGLKSAQTEICSPLSSLCAELGRFRAGKAGFK